MGQEGPVTEGDMCPHAEWRSTPCFLSGPDVTTGRTAGELQGVRQGRPPASAWKAQQLLNISINHLKGPPPSGPGLDVGLELQACASPARWGYRHAPPPAHELQVCIMQIFGSLPDPERWDSMCFILCLNLLVV